MNDVIAKSLEGALAAAGPNASAGSNNGGGSANDLVSLAAKVLPKLFENPEEREGHVEVENEGVSVLRKEVRLLRKLLCELVQSHKGVLEELSLMRKLNSTIVSHLARVQILEMPDDEEIDDEFGKFSDEDDELDEFSDEYDYADDLTARGKQRGGGAQGPNRLRNSGPRNPRPRKQ